jgi:hypothetical protein
MPANTPRGYTYPLYGDPANPAAQIQDFAQDVDADVAVQVASITTALNRPSAKVSSATAQVFVSGVAQFVTWATENYDNAAMANLGVNNDRISFTSAGNYLISTEINFNGNGLSVGSRQIRLVPNTGAAQNLGWENRPGHISTGTNLTITELYRSTGVGDFVRVEGLQNSGNGVSLAARTFTVTKVAD